jgi:hypothetical protein
VNFSQEFARTADERIGMLQRATHSVARFTFRGPCHTFENFADAGLIAATLQFEVSMGDT